MSKIEWTDETWNPITGCTKVSPGCKNCYAEKMAKRLQYMGAAKYRNGFDVTIHHGSLRKPYRWKKPRMIFVNSMSDLFHEKVPDSFIIDVFNTMVENPRHTFQVLTKRPERMAKIAWELPFSENVWLGVSVESQKYTSRIYSLLDVGAKVHFLSCEPLLGPLDLNPWLDELNWIIVGGESGPKARPMDPQWVISIRDQCEKAKVPFFFKQWGGVNKKKTGRLLHGLEYNGMPTI